MQLLNPPDPHPNITTKEEIVWLRLAPIIPA